MQRIFVTKSEKETLRLGKLIARNLRAGDIVALIGELGSGKTVLVKGIALGLGISSEMVNSPSFVLIREYPAEKLNLFHFDLYRLKTLEEIEALGWEEYLNKDGVLVIEWADKMAGLLPPQHLRIDFGLVSETEREIILSAKGEKYKKLIAQLKK